MSSESDSGIESLIYEVMTAATADLVTTSVAALAEISLRSPRKLFIFIIIKKYIGSKYPKNKLFNFEKNFTGRDRDVWTKSPSHFNQSCCCVSVECSNLSLTFRFTHDTLQDIELVTTNHCSRVEWNGHVSLFLKL